MSEWTGVCVRVTEVHYNQTLIPKYLHTCVFSQTANAKAISTNRGEGIINCNMSSSKERIKQKACIYFFMCNGAMQW